jgi:hypothetical protein
MFGEIITEKYVPFGSGLDRTPGLHLTSIIRSLQEKLRLVKKADGWEMNVCADIGFLWEDALSFAYRNRRVTGYGGDDMVTPGQCGDIFRPPSYTLDGVLMSPDGIGPDPKGAVAYADHEYKCTWRSSLRQPQDDFYWDCQFKSYCLAMDTTICVLHVMYLMGDYRSSGPQHRVYRFEYTKAELDQCWEMLMRHKDNLQSRGQLDELMYKGGDD